MKPSKRDQEITEQVERLCRRLCTYGQIETAAGVTDRVSWWRGKSEEQARAELREMIANRIRRGEIDSEGGAA